VLAWWHGLIRTIDEAQQRRPWLAFPIGVVKKFSEDRGTSHAALIAYYGFFSIVPLMLVFVTLLRLLMPGHPAFQTRLETSALAGLPVVGTAITADVHALRGSLIALLLGSITALWAGLAVVGAAQQAMDALWGVPARRAPSFVRRRARAAVVLVALGGAVVLSAVLSAAAGLLAGGMAARIAWVVGAGVVNIALFDILFIFLTTTRLGWREVLPGAAVAGLAWMSLQAFGAFLVKREVTGASAYGVFAVVIGLLWWLLIAAEVTLLAAEMNVVRTRHLWPRSMLDRVDGHGMGALPPTRVGSEER
jgi:YihY family inner membrane protein